MWPTNLIMFTAKVFLYENIVTSTTIRKVITIIIFCIGTGKSTVGVHLAYTFAKLNQITKKKTGSKPEKTRCVVYCSASDSSLDVTASMC